MAKLVEIRHGRETWTGKTKREAEAARDASLERLFSQDLTPILIVGAAGAMLLCYPSTEGTWGYDNYSEGGTRRGGSTFGNYTNYTRETVQTAARRHLAQMAIRINAETGEVEESGSWILAPDDEIGRTDHEAYVRWQVGFALGRRRGFDDNKCRELAAALMYEKRAVAMALQAA